MVMHPAQTITSPVTGAGSGVSARPLLGAIEAGGTKFNCALADEQGHILREASFATEAPAQTLAAARDFFLQNLPEQGHLAALGVASFGPLDLDPLSATYGELIQTPKPGWSGVRIKAFFEQQLRVPVAIETDVNGAALGEASLGAARACRHFVYVTVGTGIGAGVVINGHLLQGRVHPEIGHMLMPQAEGDNYSGCCPFHRHCLEGLASGSALRQRWQADPSGFAEDHPAWASEAFYLAAMCVNLTHCYGPEKIVLGGGVMQQAHLFARIRQEFARLINGYADARLLADLDSYIVPTALSGRAGVLGCLKLAKSLLL